MHGSNREKCGSYFYSVFPQDKFKLEMMSLDVSPILHKETLRTYLRMYVASGNSLDSVGMVILFTGIAIILFLKYWAGKQVNYRIMYKLP